MASIEKLRLSPTLTVTDGSAPETEPIRSDPLRVQSLLLDAVTLIVNVSNVEFVSDVTVEVPEFVDEDVDVSMFEVFSKTITVL